MFSTPPIFIIEGKSILNVIITLKGEYSSNETVNHSGILRNFKRDWICLEYFSVNLDTGRNVGNLCCSFLIRALPILTKSLEL